MIGIMPEREENKMSEKIDEKTLENATGGNSDISSGMNKIEEWYQKAKAMFTSPVYVPFPCPKCNASVIGFYSVFSAGTTGDINSPTYFTYYSCQCFNCDRDLGPVNGLGEWYAL